jgi:hypothetical protein
MAKSFLLLKSYGKIICTVEIWGVEIQDSLPLIVATT